MKQKNKIKLVPKFILLFLVSAIFAVVFFGGCASSNNGLTLHFATRVDEFTLDREHALVDMQEWHSLVRSVQELEYLVKERNIILAHDYYNEEFFNRSAVIFVHFYSAHSRATVTRLTIEDSELTLYRANRRGNGLFSSCAPIRDTGIFSQYLTVQFLNCDIQNVTTTRFINNGE